MELFLIQRTRRIFKKKDLRSSAALAGKNFAGTRLDFYGFFFSARVKCAPSRESADFFFSSLKTRKIIHYSLKNGNCN